MTTYELGETDGRAWIKCLTCNVTSHNPHDVANRYCGNCHRFLLENPVTLPSFCEKPARSVAIQRLLDEVRTAGPRVEGYFDRAHNRHNRS